jgi:hypothetical protein
VDDPLAALDAAAKPVELLLLELPQPASNAAAINITSPATARVRCDFNGVGAMGSLLSSTTRVVRDCKNDIISSVVHNVLLMFY